jgi:DMSO/TMAO reductase YedYZ molybdopterin-dependent catalytic subunit
MTAAGHAHAEPDWVHGHPHEPNPAPPSADATITLILPDGQTHRMTVEALRALPFTIVPDCYIVSTGHGTSGPFRFGGVTLRALLAAFLPAEANWQFADVISGDGFGARLQREEVLGDAGDRPMLLAYMLGGEPLTRQAGLVRLIAPTETDDALKQVKWVAQIVVK